jgi:flavin reductase (DIM6/NTAB) family NADH-FMN oxidoreductase RutF
VINKVELPPDRLMYPRPTLLVGSNVDGKANFMAVAGGGVVCAEPPMIGVPIRHRAYTLKGVRQNMTFSINTPSVDLVKEADFCGITSGADVDKVKICRFKVFYGHLKTVPLIEQCPVNLECRVVQILTLDSHCFVIGQVEGTYLSEDCLTDGKPDVDKIRPIIFDITFRRYFAFGEVIAEAYKAGLELKERP